MDTGQGPWSRGSPEKGLSRHLHSNCRLPRRPAKERRPVTHHGDDDQTRWDEPEQPPKDACGVFGCWAPGEDVAKLTYFGLYALPQRGQEAAGMAVSDGTTVVVYNELGLVAQVFDEATLSALTGHLAVGHTRYSTTGSCTWENAQPSYRPAPNGGGIALGHNGNLTNTSDLAAKAHDPVDPSRPLPKATN